MISQIAVICIVVFVSVYALKDWYKALCIFIVFLAINERPYVPYTMLGIPGMNPWNLMMFFILIGSYFQSKKESISWDMPRGINRLLFIYACVIVIAVMRMVENYGLLAENIQAMGGVLKDSKAGLINDYMVNALKYLIPGMLLFHGARDNERVKLACYAILLSYLIIGLGIVYYMPLGYLIGGGSNFDSKAAIILSKRIGFHRVDLSMMMAGASWAFIAATLYFKKIHYRMILLGCALLLFFAMGLTGGRTGYVSWAIIGGVVTFVRWKKLFLLLPVFGAVAIALLPAVENRLSTGFEPEDLDHDNPYVEEFGEFSSGIDWFSVTSGRIFAWRFVKDEIATKPILGWGRHGMKVSQLQSYLWNTFRETFPHPHNAYLELILDSGIVGFVPVVLLYLIIFYKSWHLFKHASEKLYLAVGGISLSLTTSFLAAGIGAQSFFPKEGMVLIWCAIGLALRVTLLNTKQEMELKEEENIKLTNKPKRKVWY